MHTLTAQLVEHVLLDLGLDGIPSGMPDRVRMPTDSDISDFASRYLAYNLVRKVEPFSQKEDVPRDVLSRSLRAFADAEWNCAVINRHGRYFSVIDSDEAARFSEASRLAALWISETLMDYWPRWEHPDYTSGASRNLPRSSSLRVIKENGGIPGCKLSATTSALAYLEMIERPWHAKGCEIVRDSRFDFVQKTAKNVRFMAMEPEYNMLVQKSIGDCIRAALIPRGINLNDQLPNQQLSLLGSVFRTRATIDLTSASDCLSIVLLRYLPKRWQEWIMDARSPVTSVGNTSHKLEKIATMGNGFIFELQSLIFAAFAYGITTVYGGRECDIAVYGDDIIVSTACAKPLMAFLEWHGLIPNIEKSYWDEDEPFRESCGKHWLAGRDVTPFYVKEPIGTLPTIFRAYNGLKYWSQRTGIALPSACRFLISLIDRKDRVIVPQSWAITSGLHWPCRDAVFPKKRYCKKLQRLVVTQRALDPGRDDVTEIIADQYRLAWFFYEPPAELIDRRYYPPSGLHGFPREALRFARGTQVATSEWRWGHREVVPGDGT